MGMENALEKVTWAYLHFSVLIFKHVQKNLFTLKRKLTYFVYNYTLMSTALLPNMTNKNISDLPATYPVTKRPQFFVFFWDINIEDLKIKMKLTWDCVEDYLVKVAETLCWAFTSIFNTGQMTILEIGAVLTNNKLFQQLDAYFQCC